MRKIFILLALLFSALNPFSEVSACQCPGMDPTIDFFYSSFFVWEQQFPKSIIIKAKYIGIRNGYGTELKILKTFYGRPVNPDTVVAWGSDGSDCRGYLGRFYNVGDTVIVALRNLTDPIPPPFGPESTNDYWLWACTLAHVQVKGDSVYGGGPLSFTFPSYSLNLFEDSIANRVRDIPLDIAYAGYQGKYVCTLSPNPASDFVFIRWNQMPYDSMVISVLDMTGKLILCTILDHRAISVQQGFKLDLSRFSQGMYLVAVKTSLGQQSFRLLVRNSGW